MSLVSRSFLLLALLAPAGLLGCSGGDDGSGAADQMPGFPGFCTGRASHPLPLGAPDGLGRWESSGTEAPAGTLMLLGTESTGWGGYTISSDGTARKVDLGFEGMTRDTDFTTSCATEPSPWNEDFVLLENADGYQLSSLTGEPCRLPAGTTFDEYMFQHVGSDAYAELSAPELTALCGSEVVYSDHLVWGKVLLVR